MKCPECGEEVGADERFCGNCGTPLQDIEPASPVEEEISSGDETIRSEPPPWEEPEALPGEETIASEPPPPPLEPTPPPPPVLKRGSGDRTGLIITIVVLVILVLCCCCILAVVGLNLETISEDLGDIFAMVVPALTEIA